MPDKISGVQSLALINQLNETAIKYNRDIKYAPLSYALDAFNKMGVLLVPGIQNKYVDYTFLRRGGIMRPYKQGMSASTEELGKFKQNEFKVYRAAGIEKDNIQNYRPVDVVGTNLGRDEVSGKNPADPQIFYSYGATWGEDLKDALFHAVRNDDGTTKYDLFDGYEKLMRDAEGTGEISEEEGNQYKIDAAITMPVDEKDTTAYDIVDEFLSHSSVEGGAILNVTKETARAIRAATFNKFRFTMPADQYGRYVIPGYEDEVVMNVNKMMGYGDRMILSKGDIFQLGYDTQFDKPFIRARQIDDDDQIITYSIGAEYGTSIRSFHRKFFMTSGGVLTPIAYAGDYNGAGKYTVTIPTPSNGTVEVTPTKEKYSLGDIVTLTAKPSDGYVFDKWSDNSLDATRRILVKGNINLSATFKAQS